MALSSTQNHFVEDDLLLGECGYALATVQTALEYLAMHEASARRPGAADDGDTEGGDEEMCSSLSSNSVAGAAPKDTAEQKQEQQVEQVGARLEASESPTLAAVSCSGESAQGAALSPQKPLCSAQQTSPLRTSPPRAMSSYSQSAALSDADADADIFDCLDDDNDDLDDLI